MRAVAVAEAGTALEVVEVPDPTPAPDEVVLRVEACGICGSDLHLTEAFPLVGLVLGHELCGTVVAVGSDVEGWIEGDRAAGLPLATCGTCLACRSGRVRKCERTTMIGIERAGGYAEHIALPARSAFRLPDAVDAIRGALVEPLAIGLHAVERAGLRIHEDVLVIGAGPIGLTLAMWLRALGAGEVVVSDPVAGRRSLATRLGASATIDPAAGDVGTQFADCTGARPSLVIECVGVPGMIQHAAQCAAVDGRVVVSGVCMAPDRIEPFPMMEKELDLRFAYYYRTQDFERTISMLASERVDPTPMVTSEVDLDGAPAAFAALRSPSDDAKVVIRP